MGFVGSKTLTCRFTLYIGWSHSARFLNIIYIYYTLEYCHGSWSTVQHFEVDIWENAAESTGCWRNTGVTNDNGDDAIQPAFSSFFTVTTGK